MRVSDLTNEIEAYLMNKLPIIASLAAGLALQQVANAGTIFKDAVFINHGTGPYATYASGSFHQALLSSTSLDYIGCSAETDYIPQTQITCWARDAAGHYAGCYMLSPPDAWRQIASAVGEYSLLYFAADSSFHCTDIEVDNSTYNK